MSGLELICNDVRPQAPRPDILLLHGISTGAWMWQDNALPWFGDRGYRAWALSLSGHGNSRGRETGRQSGLDGYSHDLAEALQRIQRPTVVIAHSLGGAVLQHYLSRGGLTAGSVLLCSVPPYGLWRASIEMSWRHPLLWRELATYSLFGLAHTNIGVLRKGLFPNGVDDQTFNSVVDRLQHESLLAISNAMGWPPFAPMPLSQQNMLVIGGADDRLIPQTDVHATAAYYGVDAHVIEGAGHMLMYEEGGKQAARIVLSWLAQWDGHAQMTAPPATGDCKPAVPTKTAVRDLRRYRA